MSNFFRNGWCRYCRAILPHKFIEQLGSEHHVICENCGATTPIRYFNRLEVRRKEYLRSVIRNSIRLRDSQDE